MATSVRERGGGLEEDDEAAPSDSDRAAEKEMDRRRGTQLRPSDFNPTAEKLAR